MVDDGNRYFLATRGTVLVVFVLTGLATVALAAVVGLGVAAVISFLLVGPTVHGVMGKLMQRRPDLWGGLGDGIIVAGITYPLLLWIGGAIFVATTRSLALGALIAVGPPVLFVIVALVWDENRGPLRAADRQRRAFAAEHGWRYVADGTEVLRDHWASAPGEQPEVTAAAVLAGEIGGWPVTICNTLDRRARSDQNLTVTWLVHLPVSLPHTIAVPSNSSIYERHAQGRPWEPTPVQGYPLSVEDLYLASTSPAFGELVATPEVRKATIDGDIVFWRIIGRDLSLARRSAGKMPLDKAVQTASRLVTLARALPADALATYGTPPDQPPPFRAPSPGDGTDSRAST